MRSYGRDVLSIDWLVESKDAGRLLEYRPRHYIHLSEETCNEMVSGRSNPRPAGPFRDPLRAREWPKGHP